MTMFCVKWLGGIFIILVPVSEFVVVDILSEWWSGPTTAGHCGHIPATASQKNEDESLLVASNHLYAITSYDDYTKWHSCDVVMYM